MKYILPLLILLLYASPLRADEVLLDEIERKAFDYFVMERNPANGLIRDWAWNVPKGVSNSPATVAGTGFALTAYGVGVERGWLSKGDAMAMTKLALTFLKDQAPSERGFFYHFLSMDTGGRVSKSELSPIDTALAMAGVLFAAEYYDDPEIKQLAQALWDRIDWPWMLNGEKTFALAWSPERKFQRHRWGHYDESTLLYILALGSKTNPIPAESWKAVRRSVASYGDYKLIYSPPLFTHQYPHIWIDFRNKNDGYADYFENSRRATLAQRQFAIDESSKFKSYGPNSWGFTAAEGPFGYKAYGAPPGWATHDGTIAPTGCGGSVPFAPEETIACLKHIKEAYGDRLWGRYGFGDAFHVDKDWYSEKAFAINQGPIVLMIENYRSNLIWNVMNRTSAIQEGMKRAGFQEGTKELEWKEPPTYDVPYRDFKITVGGSLSDWPKYMPRIKLDLRHVESGSFDDAEDLSGDIRFVWDEEYLYFAMQVRDDSPVYLRTGKEIWRDDLLELFVDPANDGLKWGNPRDYQLGFRVDPPTGTVKAWSWFAGSGDLSLNKSVRVMGRKTPHGYVIEGKIKWSYLKIRPEAGARFGLTPTLHDFDQDRSEGKLAWFFRPEGQLSQFRLGVLQLKNRLK